MMKSPVETQNKEMLDVVRRMAILAEYRDKEVAHHVDRIHGYCRILAFGLDLSPHEADVIAVASMLHDVGKASVPFDVLQKTERLTQPEWELIKQHTMVGAEALRGSPNVYLQMGETIARTHHERWDGSGYPDGLSGEDIPLSGRICAIADVFDALTTSRPYKDPIRPDEALVLLRKSSGTLFDPQLVRIFAENFEEVRRVRTQNI